MSTAEKKLCLLCKKECDSYRYAMCSTTEYACSHCGLYVVNDFVDTKKFKILASMYYYLLHMPSKKDCVYFVSDETKFEDTEKVSHIGINTLENFYPRNFSQKIDMILLSLSRLYKEIGQEIEFMNSKAAPNDNLRIALFVDKENLEERNREISSIFSLLAEMGLLIPLNDVKSTMPKYKISANGWLKIQELEASNKVISQGFIAMWFAPAMDSVKAKIISAIRDSGYASMIISDKEHNNQIVPEILYEIKQSVFVVADLTGHRNGVYYEAGYAGALGKEVILTCNEEDFEKRHFDISQQNIIKWKDENELYEKLLKRIESTVGKNK